MPDHHPENLPAWDVRDRTPSESPLDPGSTNDPPTRKPGDYIVEKLELLSPNVGQDLTGNVPAAVNIIPIYDTISLYEDISKPYLLMDVAIIESIGLREIIPIIGEEFIHIIASTQGVTPGMGDMTAAKHYAKWDSVLDKIFRVTSTSAVVSTSERVKRYVLHCCSVEAIINEKTRISKGYVNVTIDEIIRDIYKNEIIGPLQTDYNSYCGQQAVKPLIIEPTTDLHQYSFPFKKPFEVFADLAEKALSKDEPETENAGDGDATEEKQTGGALYMFYETFSAFRFESLESIMNRQKGKREIWATPEPILHPNMPGDITNRVIDWEIDGLFDIVDNLREGMYASKLITHDMTRMRYDITGYRYIEKEPDFETESPDGTTTTVHPSHPADISKKRIPDLTLSLATTASAGKLCSDKNDLLNDNAGGEGSRVKFMATDFNHSYFYEKNRKDAGGGKEAGIKESNLERRKQLRDSQLQQLDNIKLTLKMNGDSSLRVGEILFFWCPSLTVSDIGEGESRRYDKFLSGRYLITKIKHNFNIENYTMDVQIRKDSWDNDLPAFDQALNQNKGQNKTSKEEILEARLGTKESAQFQAGSDENISRSTITGMQEGD
jgi:hypothetical protein